MSNKTSQTSISPKAKKWLNSFSDQVDFHRFQRGVLLYDKEHVLDISIDPIGFKAVVQGSKNKRYELNGEFILDGPFPDMKSFTVSCSCPDDVPFCKHSVCAVFKLITYFEKTSRNKKQENDKIIELTKCDEMIEAFEKNIPSNDDNVLSLPNESFWTFESSFNEAMRDIDYVLGNLLQELKR